jgi:hypothetical protein
MLQWLNLLSILYQYYIISYDSASTRDTGGVTLVGSSDYRKTCILLRMKSSFQCR